MSETVTRVPAVEGWFTTDPDDPRLIGAKCPVCSTIVFPPRAGATIVEEKGSHAIYVSKPEPVAALIKKAAQSVMAEG